MHTLTAVLACIASFAGHSTFAALSDFIVYDYDVKMDGPIRTAGSTYPGAKIELPGRLYIPSNYAAASGTPFALVVAFHGSGEGFQYVSGGGINLDDQVTGSHFNNLLARCKTDNHFLYVPQSEANSQDSAAWPYTPVMQAMNMVKQAMRDYPKIDPRRIYVTGLSAGGRGCREALACFADVIAAGVPVCSDKGNDEDLFMSGLVDKPIWIFHSALDTELPPSKARNYVNALRSASGKNTIPLSAWRLCDVTSIWSNDGSPYFSLATSARTTHLASYSVAAFDSPNLKYTEFNHASHGYWGNVYNESVPGATGSGTGTGKYPLYSWLWSQNLGAGLPAPLAEAETLLFDFGVTRLDPTKDAANRYWNGTVYGEEKTVGPGASGPTNRVIVAYAVTSTGKRTPVSMELAGAFGNWHKLGYVGTGAPYGNAELNWDGWLTTAFATSTTNTGIVRFTGLNPNAPYEVKIWGSCTTADSTYTRETYYEINGTPQLLNALNNTNTFVTFASVNASASGQLDVKVYPKAGARYGVLNSMELKALPSTLAVNDTVTTNESAYVDISVLANDQGSGLSIQSISNIVGGTATIVGGNQIRYTPAAGFYGTGGFNYSIGAGPTGTAAVTVTVNSTATAYNLSVASLTGANIGTSSGGSSRVLAGGDWEVNGSGGGIAGTADSFHNEAGDVTGDFQMFINVKSLVSTGAAPRAGLMIRESNDADARMVYLSATSGTTYRYGSRTTVGGAVTETTPSETYASPNAWLFVERTGNTIRVMVSSDDVTYTEVGSITMSGLAATLKAGVFSSSGTVGVNTRAVMAGYEKNPLPTALSDWKADETTGTTASDNTGFQDGTLNGNAAWTTGGKFKGGLTFDGTNDWVQMADRPEYGGTAFSVSMWFKAPVVDGVARSLISKRQGPSTQAAFCIYTKSSNHHIWVEIAGSANAYDTGFEIFPNTWYHITMVFDGTLATNRLKVYVNGGAPKYQGQPTPAAIPDTTAPLCIGLASPNYGSGFNGVIDQVRIFNRALTQAEVDLLEEY